MFYFVPSFIPCGAISLSNKEYFPTFFSPENFTSTLETPCTFVVGKIDTAGLRDVFPI